MVGRREIASAKLSPARMADVSSRIVDRMRPISASVASNSKASFIWVPVRSNKARSPVKTVTSSGRGAERDEKKAFLCLTSGPFSSLTESMGIKPRYSMRRPTSAAFGAAIEPLTTSPIGVRAR